MIGRLLRLSALLCLLLVILTLLPMAASAARGFAGSGPDSYRQGTVPGTLPTATPTHKPEPTQLPKPTKPPKPTPTATSRPQPAPAHRSSSESRSATIGQYRIVHLVGNRLSPVLYAWTEEERLYWSPDDGLRWRYVTTRPPVSDFVLSAADPAVLYSGAGIECTLPDTPPAPFLRSDTRGVRWEVRPTALDLVPYLIDPSDPHRLFGADCELPFFSDDGGESWSARPDIRVTSPWFQYRVKDMVDAPLSHSGAADYPVSTWSPIYAGGALDSGNSVVAVSEDEGITWTTISPPHTAGMIGLRHLEADPYVAGRLWAADAQGVWYTEDMGVNWKLISAGLEEVTSFGGRASFDRITDLTYAPAAGQLFLASTRGLYVLPPGASAWQLVVDQGFSRMAIDSLVITESNPRQLWINGDESVFRYRIP